MTKDSLSPNVYNVVIRRVDFTPLHVISRSLFVIFESVVLGFGARTLVKVVFFWSASVLGSTENLNSRRVLDLRPLPAKKKN